MFVILAVVSVGLVSLIFHIFGELGLFHVLISILLPPALLLVGLIFGIIGIFRDEKPLFVGLILNGIGLLVCVAQAWLFVMIAGGP